MKFKFCGEADCPDWVLAEINSLSKLSSVKVKLLAQVAAKGITNPPIDMDKAERLFTDSKLDQTIDLKACIACITYILNSTCRFNCDHNALHSELQQLGLPREHSNSIKRVLDEQSKDIISKLKASSLKVNALEKFSTSPDIENNTIHLELVVNGKSDCVLMTSYTANVLLDNLKLARTKMVELNNHPFTLY